MIMCPQVRSQILANYQAILPAAFGKTECQRLVLWCECARKSAPSEWLAEAAKAKLLAELGEEAELQRGLDRVP